MGIANIFFIIYIVINHSDLFIPMSQSSQNTNIDQNTEVNPQSNIKPEEFSTFSGQSVQSSIDSSTPQTPNQGESVQAGAMGTPTPPSAPGGKPPGNGGGSFMSKINLSFLGKIQPKFYVIGITLIVAIIGLAYFINSYLIGTRAGTNDITITVSAPETAQVGQEINVGVRLSNDDYFTTGADICMNYNANIMQYIPGPANQVSQAPDHFNEKIVDRIGDPRCPGGIRKAVAADKADLDFSTKTVTVFFKFKALANGNATFTVNTGSSGFSGNFDENQGAYSIPSGSVNASGTTRVGGGRAVGYTPVPTASPPRCNPNGGGNGNSTIPSLGENARWYRICPIDQNGLPVWEYGEGKCSEWMNVPLEQGGVEEQYIVNYGDFEYTRSGVRYLYQRTVNETGDKIWDRSCPMDDTWVVWDSCSSWAAVPDSKLPKPIATQAYGSYSAFSYEHNGRSIINEAFISLDGQTGWGRYCPTNSNGPITQAGDFSGFQAGETCTQWFDVNYADQSLALPGTRKYTSLAQFSFKTGDRTMVSQAMIEKNGRRGWSRYCAIGSNGLIDEESCNDWCRGKTGAGSCNEPNKADEGWWLIDYNDIEWWQSYIPNQPLTPGERIYSAQAVFTFTRNGKPYFQQALISSPDGDTPVLPTPTGGESECPDGMICGDDGICKCPDGQEWCDGQCVPVGTCGDDDTDDDGIPDSIDQDDDNDGISDQDEGDSDAKPDNGDRDTDGDGIPDARDVDSDDDGITDLIEGQPSPIARPYRDILPSNVCRDVGEDGFLSVFRGGINPVDTDGDGTPDYIDLDSDGDGVEDTIEGHDAKQPLGVTDTEKQNRDSDRDGLDDAYDTADHTDTDCNGWLQNLVGTNAPLQDTDNDGTEDWRDTDDDGDGIPTGPNGNPNGDEDANNNNNWKDDDSDNDGIPAYLDPDEGGENEECPDGTYLCNGECIPVGEECEPGETGTVNLNLQIKFQGIIQREASAQIAGGSASKPSEETLNTEVALTSENYTKVIRGEFVPYDTIDDQAVNTLGRTNLVWLWRNRDPLTFDNVPLGETFKVFVKGPKHLQKKVCENNPQEPSAPVSQTYPNGIREGGYTCTEGQITLVAGNNDLDFTGIYQLAGEIPLNGTGPEGEKQAAGQDKIVDAVDITTLRNALKRDQAERQETDLLNKADLSLNAIVDAQDYQLAIYSLGFKYDDELLDDTDDRNE